MTAIDQLPSGSFRVRYRAGGKRLTSTFDSQKEARAFVATLDGSGMPASTAPRFDEWLAKWWPEHAATVKPSTAERYKKVLNLYVIQSVPGRPGLGHLPLDQITPAVLRSWQSRLLVDLSPATVRLARTIAAMSLKEAVIDDLIQANPFARVKGIRVPKKQVRILSEEDVLLLASSIKPRWRAMVLMGGYLGLRIGELCALRLQDLDLTDTLQTTIHKTRTKVDGQWIDGPAKTENSQRVLQLPKFLVAELEEHMAAGYANKELIFTGSRGGALQPDHFRKFPWAKALRISGLGELRVHDLRHTAVSLWIRQGASPNLIAYMAGHSSVQYVLDTYGHLYGDEGHELAARLDAGRPPMPATALAALPARERAARQLASSSAVVLL